MWEKFQFEEKYGQLNIPFIIFKVLIWGDLSNSYS